MIVINKLTNRTGPEKIPEMDTKFPPPNVKTINAAVPEKLTINFFGLKRELIFIHWILIFVIFIGAIKLMKFSAQWEV